MNNKMVIAALTFFCSAFSVQAATPQWSGSDYFLRTRGIAVATLLKDLGANYHVPVIVSNQVTDTFTGQIMNEGPDETLKRLEKLYDLVSFYDGGVVHVYKANEIKNKVVTSQYLQPEMLKKYLANTGITFNRSCMLRQVNNYQAFEIQGVPACVERVVELAREVDNKAKIKATTTETMRVFPLKFASAGDQNYTYRNQTVVVPGVVSILKGMKSSNSLPLGDGKDAAPNESAATEFSADSNHNSVIVRAREVDMPIYSQLITELDKRQRQIEISVAIIDVDAGNLKALGVDWSGKVNAGGFGVSFNTGVSDGNSNYMSSVVSNSSDFMAKVSALQQNSQAQILSQPSVITQDNVQAILDKNVTFYTKLVGKDVAKLESVTSGTLMRVTPRIIEHEGHVGDEVMLQLDIQDGQQAAATNSNEPLPQVQNSEITTQATLKGGDSLLLGGFIQDKHIESKSGVPFLSDIPVLGNFFSTTSKETHRVVRLFLIKANPVSF